MVRMLSEKPETGIHIQRNPIHVVAVPLFSRHLTGKIDTPFVVSSSSCHCRKLKDRSISAWSGHKHKHNNKENCFLMSLFITDQTGSTAAQWVIWLPWGKNVWTCCRPLPVGLFVEADIFRYTKKRVVPLNWIHRQKWWAGKSRACHVQRH